jgi:hypothetical protein
MFALDTTRACLFCGVEKSMTELFVNQNVERKKITQVHRNFYLQNVSIQEYFVTSYFSLRVKMVALSYIKQKEVPTYLNFTQLLNFLNINNILIIIDSYITSVN